MNFAQRFAPVSQEPELEELEPFTPEEQAAWNRQHSPKTGPTKFRWLTAGQVRRRAEREERAKQRKTNRRYRADWMLKQQRLANLRGQLSVVGQGTPLAINAERRLERDFGSVDEARAVYAEATSK